MHFAGEGGCFGVSPNRAVGISSLRRRRPSWDSSPYLDRTLLESSQVSVADSEYFLNPTCWVPADSDRFGPSGFHSNSGRLDPLLRAGRPRGRQAGLHGVSRALRGSGTDSSAGIGLALPASRFGGDPVFPSVPRVANRRPQPRLSQPRVPLQGTPEVVAGQRGPTSPSRASFPFSAWSEADSVNAGSPRPPPSVLSVSHALDGLHPATPLRACFVPVTLLGFHLQGFAPPGGPYPFQGRCSLAIGDIRQSR
jgi:hypothetical protein